MCGFGGSVLSVFIAALYLSNFFSSLSYLLYRRIDMTKDKDSPDPGDSGPDSDAHSEAVR